MGEINLSNAITSSSLHNCFITNMYYEDGNLLGNLFHMCTKKKFIPFLRKMLKKFACSENVSRITKEMQSELNPFLHSRSTLYDVVFGRAKKKRTMHYVRMYYLCTNLYNKPYLQNTMKYELYV